jgi:hypothetical protein
MAARTYVPGLRFWLNRALRFMQRWQTKLQGQLTTEQYACLTSTIQAVLDCLEAIPEPTKVD